MRSTFHNLESPFLSEILLTKGSRYEQRPDLSRLAIQSPFERTFEQGAPRFELQETTSGESSVVWKRETAAAPWTLESEQSRGDEDEAYAYETPLEENEFRVDRLPAKAQAQFSQTDSAAWRDAVAEAIGAGVKNPNDLADIIFFMQHRDRIVNGVGKPIDKGELDFFKLRAEWNLYHTIANRRLSPSAACAVFLPVKSGNYEQYVARHTTGRITPMVNGRTSGKNKTEAFDDMQKEVESLGPNDSIFLAAYLLNPTSLTVAGPAGLTNWGDLLARKAQEGVKIRIIISDLPPDTPWGSDLTALNTTIGQLPESARDNLKYIASPHPAKVPDPRKLFLAKVSVAAHHQKFMVVRKGRTVVAYCGGLDISPERIPAGWTSKFVWHDIHAKLEGLVARDIEREFVLRWNREKDKSTATKLADWKPFENLAQAPLGSADREPGKNTHKLQVLRTLSVGVTASDTLHPETWHPDVRRDDIWQGYFRLIGCASRFLFMENQYFHEPKMADAIVKQAEAQADLLVIIVVAFEIDDPTNALTEHGRALQNEFFTRLFAGIPTNRRRVYTMSGRLVHSKLVLVDDQALSMGSANANPRDFFMDTQLNVMLDDAEAVRSFRHHLWSHDLGISEAKVAGWGVSDFMAQWDAVAKANGLKKTPDQMTGEGVISFDPTKVKGKKSSIPDFLTELDGGELGEDAPSGES